MTSSAIAMQTASSARTELAPSGMLRVGINFGNALLAVRDASTGSPGGIAVDLAHELARRIGVAIDIVAYDAAGVMADAAAAGAWDVAFLASDPMRADSIAFTDAYLDIESTYLVPPESPLLTIADVDRDGVRIAVSGKSAYDLFLTRALRHAMLVRAASVNASVELFMAQKLDALAGLRPLLVDVAETLPGSRVLDGSFATVHQAIGTPKRRSLAAAYLRTFVEDAKASGLVAAAIERNHVRGVSVAARGSAP